MEARMPSDSKLVALSIVERICSVFSLLGCIFIIVTFCSSTYFQKPINRLVFYASFGNMMSNVGTLMSRTYTGSPHSVGCQFQAFLIQMFMPADAFWTLAMAINVYLTFYFRFNAARLRRLEPYYMLLCYGVPFVPALTYVFIENSQGNRVYGDATLWCWVSTEWDIWRITTFYAPVWVIIFITIFIYIRAGRTIYEKRRMLRDIHSTNEDQVTTIDENTATMKTTEVTVVTENLEDNRGITLDSPLKPGPVALATAGRCPQAYTVTISSDTVTSGQMYVPREDASNKTWDHRTTVEGQMRPATGGRPSKQRRNYELNDAAWSYTKCSILFFTAILITWIPSSAYRVYTVVHPGKSLSALEFMSAFVLPLQGFWNAVIYVVTSWTACTQLMLDWRLGRRPDVTEIVDSLRLQEGPSRRNVRKAQPSNGHRNANRFETESMTGLAGSRDASADGRASSTGTPTHSGSGRL